MSVEFLVIIISLMIVFSILFYGFFEREKELDYQQSRQLSDGSVKILALGINKAYLKGDGTEVQIVLPKQINGEDYDVLLFSQQHLIGLEINETLVTFPIVTSNVNLAADIDEYVLVRNVGGVIYVQ